MTEPIEHEKRARQHRHTSVSVAALAVVFLALLAYAYFGPLDISFEIGGDPRYLRRRTVAENRGFTSGGGFVERTLQVGDVVFVYGYPGRQFLPALTMYAPDQD